MVLVLHINEAQFLLFVLTDEADKLTALLDLVQTLDKLVSEVLNPLDVLIFDLDKGVSDALLPLADD